ncbi:MAG: hypothetical protein AVDCRST_MAG33-1213, partial [uncultured Thermomicrobiales bacterium]
GLVTEDHSLPNSGAAQRRHRRRAASLSSRRAKAMSPFGTDRITRGRHRSPVGDALV